MCRKIVRNKVVPDLGTMKDGREQQNCYKKVSITSSLEDEKIHKNREEDVYMMLYCICLCVHNYF